jgi:ATP-binding cassette subfamily F protein 3
MREEYPDRPDVELRGTLALFLFGAEDIDKPISTLSGGERARLSLAKLMLKKVNLLIMDEPTNHLDIGSREALEDALIAFPGTIIAVSHDRYFINRIATRIIELAPLTDRGMFDYPLEEDDDAFAEYMRKRSARGSVAPVTVEKKSESGKAEYEEKKRENAKRRADEKRLKRAEQKIAELEAELAALEEELFGPAATDYVRAAEIDRRKSEIEEELLLLYEIVMD